MFPLALIPEPVFFLEFFKIIAYKSLAFSSLLGEQTLAIEEFLLFFYYVTAMPAFTEFEKTGFRSLNKLFIIT